MSSAGTDYERLRDALYELLGNSDIRFGWESDRVAAEAEAIFEALLGELVAVREERDTLREALREIQAIFKDASGYAGADDVIRLRHGSWPKLLLALAALSVVDTRPEDLGGTAWCGAR